LKFLRDRGFADAADTVQYDYGALMQVRHR
jgi:hypothetical protein